MLKSMVNGVICRCDRDGRVIGGLASLPGLGWFPLKVYRPCPALTKAGMSYVRCVISLGQRHPPVVHHLPRKTASSCCGSSPSDGSVSLLCIISLGRQCPLFVQCCILLMGHAVQGRCQILLF